jgi:large subunit ribosomal protein L6
MSRIGKRPVPVPGNVTATVTGQTVKVKGPKGELSLTMVPDVTVAMTPEGVTVTPRNDSKKARAMWGMQRTMVANLITGVTTGYSKVLEIQGVGYRAAMAGKNLQLNLGYSHDVLYKVPEGIAVSLTKPTEIVVSGIDKQKVGQVCAEIREYRPPEPYQGKGVRLRGEFVYRKEGKKK